MKLNNTGLIMRCIVVGIFVSFISACSENYEKVSFNVDDILPASTIIITNSKSLSGLNIDPTQTITSELEVTKIGSREVKDVWLEVELSPINGVSRTQVTAKTLFFDKTKKSSLTITGFGYDSENKSGIYVDCSAECLVSQNDLISFATTKTTDLGGFSFLVKKDS